MRHKKYLAALICLLFGLTGAFACPGCIEAIPVPASVTGDNPRVFIDRNANAQFWFSEPNNVNVYNYRNYPTDQRIQNSGTYRIVYEYGIPFIHFDWDAPNSRSQRIIGERFLMLRKEQQMLLYDGNAEPAFWAFHGGNILLGSELLQNVRASSTLTHGGLHFAATPDRLGTHINRVWAVEGGVGERLYFERMWAHQLALSIGYVHYSRPYLFQANSRPKRLRISSANSENFFEVELEDTPHYQVIDLSALPWEWWGEWGHERRMIIEILEVRPGFRYNHTCINSIMLLFFGG